MKNVLLVVHTKTFFQRMLELGKLLHQDGAFRLTFHFAYKTGWVNMREELDALEQHGFELSARTRTFRPGPGSASAAPAAGTDSGKSGLRAFLKARLRPATWSQLAEFRQRLRQENFLVSLLKLSKELAEVDQLILEESADIMVIASDVPHWNTGVFIRAARLRGVPSVVLFSQTGPLDEAINVFSRKWHLSTRLPGNSLVGKLFPKWVNEKDGRRFLMKGAGRTLAAELLQVTMPQPWIESSSYADAVMIENEAYYQRGVAAGLKADNLYQTGYPFHDTLYQGMARPQECLEKIYSLHQLPAGKPMLLTSLLPHYEERDSSGSDFPDYWEMVTFWIKSLVRYGQFHTVVSLHPSQQRSDYAVVERLGATIARLPIPELMPVCHAYIASLTSTITMAAACGRPVINYDYAHYRNTHYRDAAGVLQVESRDQFLKTLDRLLMDTDYYASVASAQSQGAARWGRVDGRTGERINRLFHDMARKRSAAVGEAS